MGLSADFTEARVPMERSQPLPFPFGAHRPFPNHCSQLGSSCVTPAPSPKLLPSSWEPEALGSISRSVKAAPRCCSVPSWMPEVGSLSCQVLSPGGDHHFWRSAPALLGPCSEVACIPQSMLGRSWEASHRLQHTPKEKTPRWTGGDHVAAKTQVHATEYVWA